MAQNEPISAISSSVSVSSQSSEKEQIVGLKDYGLAAADRDREVADNGKRAILADFDAGLQPHEIEEKYGINKLQVVFCSCSRSVDNATYYGSQEK
ncbi:unnamed protein product [Gongylonema pulchrum]|uniref:Rhodanese domain-containing protein n=1 Tax=Gongylonema pulchrum TaxID=637853 RepID=A0A183ETH9_9BILA|nr:unnamed protein product [Gongylonema pulchrum]